MKTKDKVMSAIATLTDKLGYPPSVREIAEASGISVGTTHGHLDRLIKCGLVGKKPNGPRTIHLVKERPGDGHK
ncbi:LexA family transcriptional regulator [Cohnella sp. OV330]|uniref:LexA family protein n=1 Tax=Cohnella sp. OV330 TaxID=1855288 RepID=UPI000B7D6632|nr:winged helix-turn-helix transcriptional regulator [Cohnella sp. OV330]